MKPSPHDLWDTYLPAFRATIVDAKAGSTMCAYNAIEGQPACGSDLLLQTVLRGYWNFQGYVTSDCDAVADFWQKNAHQTSPDSVHASADALLHGTDTDCGGNYRNLGQAVSQGLISEADLDVSLRRLFEARFKLGLFDPPSMVPYASIPFSEVDSPAHRALALEAADKSIVLLKNDGILPLKTAKYKTIAVIGPNAASIDSLEGNYNAIPLNAQLPIDALRAAFSGAHVIYAQGSPYAESINLPVPRTMLHPAAGSAEEGLKAEYFSTNSTSGTPALTRVDHEIDFDWSGVNPLPGNPTGGFAVRWTGVIVPPAPGSYDFTVNVERCRNCEEFTVTVDGNQVATSEPAATVQTPAGGNARRPGGGFPRPSGPPHFTLDATDTQPHTIAIEFSRNSGRTGSGISLDWQPSAATLQPQAVDAAKKADLVIAVVGLSPRLEGEEMPIHIEGFSGGDRTDIVLPAPQRELLEQLAATGKPLVVILLNGSAVAVNWAQQHANAVVEAWYPGEAGGKAIADTLTGVNDPAGRLPITFYASVDQLPDFIDYSMTNRTYRYFTGKPLYEFGYGLSYTKFSYAPLKLSTENVHAGDPLTVETEVRNTGKMAGDEVAELYLTPPKDGNGGLSPNVQLEDFERIHLAPGQVRQVTFRLDPRQLSEVDAQGIRAMQAGHYTAFRRRLAAERPACTGAGADCQLHDRGLARAAALKRKQVGELASQRKANLSEGGAQEVVSYQWSVCRQSRRQLRRQQLNEEQRDQIGGARNRKERQITIGCMNHAAGHKLEKNSAHSPGHASESDHGGHG